MEDVGIKIIDVETIILRLDEVLPNGDGIQDMLLVRVHTDDGITGIGEAHTMPLVLKAIIDAPVSQLAGQGLRQLLIGEDPTHIDRLWEKMYAHTSILGRRGAVINAISAIDIALWDLLGKATGEPVHRLLGNAFRDSVPAYASDLMPGSVGRGIERARGLVDRGFGAVKFGWGGLGQDVGADAALVGQLRRSVGADVDLMVDVGMPIPLDSAVRLAVALAEHDVYFLEEPLSPDDLDGFAWLVERSPIPIATGEKETTRFGFRELIERGRVPIIQPDVARAGGITETRRICCLAELAEVRVIPHSWASDVLLSATLHVLATVSDAHYVEFNVMDNPLRTRLLRDPIRPYEGLLRVPDGPGLGIELDEETVARYTWGPASL